MTVVNAILLVLLAAVLGLGAAIGRWIHGVRREVAAQDKMNDAVATRVNERSKIAAIRERAESAQRTAEGVVDAGNEGVRTTHTAISDIPFGILDQIPSTREGSKAVKGVHDAVTNGVYDAISLFNRLAGESIRRGMSGGGSSSDPDEKGSHLPSEEG